MTDLNRTMTRERLKRQLGDVAKAALHKWEVDSRNTASGEYRDRAVAVGDAILAAIEAAGVRLVPVAITPLIGWHLESNLATCNPPSEIHAANWRDAWAAAVAASPYAPQKDETK